MRMGIRKFSILQYIIPIHDEEFEVLSQDQQVALEDWEDPFEDPLENPQPSAPKFDTDNSYFSRVMDTFTSLL